MTIRLQYKTQRGERAGTKKKEDTARGLGDRNLAAGFRKLSRFIVVQERFYTSFPVCCLMCVCQNNHTSLAATA
jgi:hypothetical protein